MLFSRDAIRPLLAGLVSRANLYIGTSSWKFPDWCGLLYDEELYLHNRRFSKARFERECLAEYSQVFPTVCVDSTWYRYPKPAYIADLMREVPPGFRFSFKVPDDLTLKTFPVVPGFGRRAGQSNPDFLSVAMCRHGFLRKIEPYRDRNGLILFEFTHFHPEEFKTGREFAAQLDQFLSEMPEGWQFGVEIRNRNLLHPDYLAMLHRHGVAHVYNQWTHMPPITEQMEICPPESQPFIAARFLLPPDRPHAWAKEHLTAYSRIYEIDPSAREAAQALVAHLLRRPATAESASYLYFGNELEGCALHTIADLVDQARSIGPSV
jgi:uncharacterized protein YecE (DUF72 family)